MLTYDAIGAPSKITFGHRRCASGGSRTVVVAPTRANSSQSATPDGLTDAFDASRKGLPSTIKAFECTVTSVANILDRRDKKVAPTSLPKSKTANLVRSRSFDDAILNATAASSPTTRPSPETVNAGYDQHAYQLAVRATSVQSPVDQLAITTARLVPGSYDFMAPL